MHVHLEGMGIIGSFLAWELEARGANWTWSDVEQPVNAWGACTGAIFPTGDALDQECHAEWARWYDRPRDPVWLHTVEQSSWWYCTKAAPHGAPGQPAEELGGLRRLGTPSYHFNAQRFVPATRAAFSRHRVASCPPNARRVVSHGFSRRLDHYVWGWTMRVQIEAPRAMFAHGRPAFYFREGRFVMAYAYPVPGEPWWYAGSSLIVQKRDRPRALEVEPKFGLWCRNFERLGRGQVRIVGSADVAVGWRPAAAKDDHPLVSSIDGVLYVRPMWHNGVRTAPAMLKAVTGALGL